MYFLASDYDGTLYQDEVMLARDIEKIKQFRSLGHQFGIATGRHLDSILRELDRFGIEVDFTIGNNGSAILDGSRKEVYVANIDKETVKTVHDFVVEHMASDFQFFAVNNGYTYGQTNLMKDQHTFSTHDEITLDEAMASDVICAMFGQIVSGKDPLLLSKTINQAFEGIVEACPNGAFVDVVLPKHNKANGIERLLNHTKQQVQRVFTVGDSYNDLEMLSQYHGFVIETGDHDVVARFDRRVKNVSETIDMILNGHS